MEMDKYFYLVFQFPFSPVYLYLLQLQLEIFGSTSSYQWICTVEKYLHNWYLSDFFLQHLNLLVFRKTPNPIPLIIWKKLKAKPFSILSNFQWQKSWMQPSFLPVTCKHDEYGFSHSQFRRSFCRKLLWSNSFIK